MGDDRVDRGGVALPPIFGKERAMIQVTRDVAVKSARVPGSVVQYTVWVEKDGAVVGPVHTTSDPAGTEDALARTVCQLMGLPCQESADVLFGVFVSVLVSPWFWGGLALAILL
jgi:hypothetical protein